MRTPEELREYQRVRTKRWRSANKERWKAYAVAYQKANPKRAIFNSKKATAKQQGIPFSLTFEEIYWPTHCPVLGIELEYRRSTGRRAPRYASASFERINCKKGYESGNVIIVSYRANIVRGDASVEELETVAKFWREYGKGL